MLVALFTKTALKISHKKIIIVVNRVFMKKNSQKQFTINEKKSFFDKDSSSSLNLSMLSIFSTSFVQSLFIW